jgi:hypothetical protein
VSGHDIVLGTHRRLLDEPGFHTRAAELAAVLRADTASSAAIDELEGVTRRADGMVRD